ncbi:polymer-forming cytoskeletal protein [Luteolibacter algae]|uniref:Polymer-forming cytoskeletal protein n=2 Tax=Luteolibacter algae TaxID=454151 RepID=A0ABW5D7F1_9BACT
MVISTLCRSCGQHMDVKDGKPVLRPKYATRLASSSKPPIQHPTIGEASNVSKIERITPVLRLKNFFRREIVKREIECYHCQKLFEVVPDAQSSQCPKCGGYISLRDYEVDHAWRRRIQTRGDVTILKGGSINGVHVQCHDLTVLGQLAASVECSGTLKIRSHGKIIGNVRCGELRVERGAIVEFQGDVHAKSAYIDGQVKAQLTCSEKITLEKKAHLQGLARAAGLVVKPGAKHSGVMEVVRGGADAS